MLSLPDLVRKAQDIVVLMMTLVGEMNLLTTYGASVRMLLRQSRIFCLRNGDSLKQSQMDFKEKN